MLEDLSYTIRSLRRAPAFALVVILTLALGIGANTAIFSVLYGVILRPLALPQPERLVGLVESSQGSRDEIGVTYPQYRYLAEQSSALQSLAASTTVGLNLFTGSAAAHVRGLRVSANYFPTLGVEPALGRNFGAEEDQPGGAAAVILSGQLWRDRFAGDPGVIGKVVTLDGQPFVVIGVMPADFHPFGDTELWSTLGQVSRTIGSGQNIEVVGRLKAGYTLAAARDAERAVLAQWKRQFKPGLGAEAQFDLEEYRVLVVGNQHTPIELLFGAIGLVLLIACANVANLILSRSASRHRELAVRVAIGASRLRLLRQLLTESLVVSFVGGAFGLLIAIWGLDALLAVVPPGIPRMGEVRIDGWALLFTFGLCLLTGLVFGAAPAWQSTRAALHDSLREGSGRGTGSASQGRLRHALVAMEVALSLILLVGAGLLFRTFANLVHTDPGFETGHLVSAEIWLAGARYDSAAAIHQFYADATQRIQALPGVRSAAVIEAGLPLGRGGNAATAINGDRVKLKSVDYRSVTPNFFATLGVALKRGRGLSDQDGVGAPPVAVVNEAFVRKYLADKPALGGTVDLEHSGVERQIVGVVGDVRSFVWSPAIPTIYIPTSQTPPGLTRGFSTWFPINIVARTGGDPALVQAALGQAIHAADPEVPVGQIRTMEQVLGASLAMERFLMLVLGLFAGLALLLAMIGMYGVISYLVTQRTREIGIRMALGATAGDVRRMVVGRGLRLTGLGIGTGLVGAAALTPLIASQLYDVKPLDPSTVLMVTGLVALIALVASYLPASRAMGVNPVIAMRQE